MHGFERRLLQRQSTNPRESRILLYLNCRLVHAITPSEENKSFLEKVQMGEMLCGIPEEDRLYFGLNAARPSPASTYSQLQQSLEERLQRPPPPHVWSDGSDEDDDRLGLFVCFLHCLSILGYF